MKDRKPSQLNSLASAVSGAFSHAEQCSIHRTDHAPQKSWYDSDWVPASLPTKVVPVQSPTVLPHGYIRQKQLLQIVPISAATLWRRIRAGQFPAPLKLGPRITCWKVSDVLAHLQEQGAQK